MTQAKRLFAAVGFEQLLGFAQIAFCAVEAAEALFAERLGDGKKILLRKDEEALLVAVDV